MKKIPVRSYVLTVFVAVLLAFSSSAFAAEKRGGMAIGDFLFAGCMLPIIKGYGVKSNKT